MESPDARRRTMQAVKSADTGPELIVRRLLHQRGYRYRLHGKHLPGCPDLVFSGRRKVIFVHGCFWHGHDCARGSRVPVNNRNYWVGKVSRNKERDNKAHAMLTEMGWSVALIWECELKNADDLWQRISRFLE